MKRVSRGSRFNQIYIPKQYENNIAVGDLVEVRLVEKKTTLFYSKHQPKLTKFKEEVIEQVFSLLEKFKTEYIFVVGSFLTEKIDYNDIDVVVINKKTINEEQIYSELINRLNLKFHILCIEKDKFNYLQKSCPLTRAMFSNFVSNKKFSLDNKRIIDIKHIQFLLMMPLDLLKIDLESRVFYDNIRRLVTIRRFLNNKGLFIKEINNEVKNLIKEPLYSKIKNNEHINESMYAVLRKMINQEIRKINLILKNG